MIRILCSHADSISNSFAHSRERLSALEDKICIPKRPCNIFCLSVGRSYYPVEVQSFCFSSKMYSFLTNSKELLGHSYSPVSRELKQQKAAGSEAFFAFNLPRHKHICTGKYLCSFSRKIVCETATRVCEMFTSGCRVTYKRVC